MRVQSVEDVVEPGAEHIELVSAVGRWTWCHSSPENEGILLNSRWLLHTSEAIISLFFQRVNQISGTTKYLQYWIKSK